MKRLFVIFLALPLLPLLGYGVLLYTETMAGTYATHADAMRDGAGPRGWLPAYLPATAVEIREVHNLDTNQQWLRFRVPASDARRMVVGMEPVPHPGARNIAPRPPRWRGSWMQTPDSVRLYRDTSPGPGARCLAVDGADPATVYAWSC